MSSDTQNGRGSLLYELWNYHKFCTLLHKFCVSWSFCYHSVQNLFSSYLLSKNIKTTIYSTVILPFVLYGCEAWSFTLMEECSLRLFENRVLRRIFGLQRDMVGASLSVPLTTKKNEMSGKWAIYGWQEKEGCGWERWGKDTIGRPGHKCEDSIKIDIPKKRVCMWAGLIWPRTGASGVLLWKC